MNRKTKIPVDPINDWPFPDRQAWQAAVRNGDILDEAGPLAHYSTSRLTAVRDAYGRWLGFLAREFPDRPLASGFDLIDRDRVSGYLEALRPDLAPLSVILYLNDLAYAVRGMAPNMDVSFVHAAARSLQQSAKPVRNKRERLQPTQDLYDLGFDLMRQAEILTSPHRAALLYRDGLMIALLAARPLRAGNFVQIEIGRHLVTRGAEYWLEIPAAEVKNCRPLEFPLPAELFEPLQYYMERHRSVLVRPPTSDEDQSDSALWLSRSGRPLKKDQLWAIVCRRTKERFGTPINPHLFRDAAATSIAIADPGHVHIIVRILGHATLTMSQRHYNQATSLEAARRTQDSLIARYRKK